MTVKEVLPPFIWAGVVIGATSLALAWLQSGSEFDSLNHVDSANSYVSPFGR